MDLEVVKKQREGMIDYFISNQDLQPSVLIQLARMFKCKAKLLKEKNNESSNVRALEARLRADCLAVMPLLKGLSINQTDDSSSLQLYELVRKSIDKVDLTDANKEGDGTVELISNKLSGLTLKKNQSSGFSFKQGKGVRPHFESANSAAQQVVHAIESLEQRNHNGHRELISKLDELIKVTIAKDEKQKNQSSVAMPENTGVNFNFSNVKADPSLLYIFGSNKTTTPDFSTSTTSTAIASTNMTFGNATTFPIFNNNAAANTFGVAQNSIISSIPFSQATTINTTVNNIFGVQPASSLFGVKPATTTSSSSLFGNAANSSFSQPAAPISNWFSPSSSATSQAGNFSGPKTATISPIIASPKDDDKRESNNSTSEGARALISEKKAAPNDEQESCTEPSPTKTKANYVIPSSTMTNVFRAKADNGWTVLHSACADGNLDFVKFLVEKGADVNVKTESNETVLHYSCAFGNMDVVAFLVEKGADISVKGYDGRTVLHYAAQQKKWDVIKFLVEKGAADVQAKDGGGWTVLHYAAKCGEKDIIKFLVDKGADVRAENNDGETAFQLAAYWGEKQVLDIIKFLLEKGSDVNASDKAGSTALHNVSMLSHKLDVVKCLVENGANVCAKDQLYGTTALHMAIERCGSFKIVEILVENGANIDAEDPNGETALHYASKKSELDIVKFLIDKGADVGVKNKNGQTALYFARQRGDLNIARYLIENGCTC